MRSGAPILATRIPSLPLLVMHLSWEGKKARISFQDSTRNWPDDWRDGGIHPDGGIDGRTTTDCRRRRETSFVFGRMKKRSVILHVCTSRAPPPDAVTKDEQTRWEIEWQIQRLQRAAPLPFPLPRLLLFGRQTALAGRRAVCASRRSRKAAIKQFAL